MRKHKDEPRNQSETEIENRKAYAEEEVRMKADREEARLKAEKEAMRKAEEDAHLKEDNYRKRDKTPRKVPIQWARRTLN